MPVLHSQYSGQGANPAGEVIPIPPAMVLAARGPFVNVTISVADQVTQELVKQGKPVQPAVSGIGLIDTGASTTCVDDETAQQLQLPIIDVVTMSSASHAAHQANVYPIRINIAGLPVGINAPRAVGAALNAQGLIALIGRDILVACTLHYNGMAGEITLAI
jgi:predicted aspartyl protease